MNQKERQYTKIHGQVIDKLTALLEHVADMPADAELVTWPQVGDLGKLNADLNDMIRFMGIKVQ